MNSKKARHVLVRHPWSSVDWYPWSTLTRHLSWHSINILWIHSQLIFDRFIWVGWHLAEYLLSVDQVSIGCWPSINQDIDQVLIEMLIEGINKHSTLYIWSKKATFLKLKGFYVGSKNTASTWKPLLSVLCHTWYIRGYSWSRWPGGQFFPDICPRSTTRILIY